MGSGPHDAEVAQEVLGVRARPSVVLLPVQLALDETVIQIEEREPIRLDPTLEHIIDEGVERAAS